MSFDFHKNLKTVNENYFVNNETTFSEYAKNFDYHKLVISALIKRKTDFKTVLEIGRGVGSLKKELVKLTEDLISLDLSLGFLKQQARFKADNVLSNCLKTPFKNNVFSLIILNEVIADLKPSKLNDLVHELFRILKNDGKIFLTEYGGDKSERVNLKNHKEYSVNFEEFEKLCERIGFNVRNYDLMNFIKLKNLTVLNQQGVRELIKKGFDKRMGLFYEKKSLTEQELNYLNKISEKPYIINNKFVFKKIDFFHDVRKLGNQFRVFVLNK